MPQRGVWSRVNALLYVIPMAGMRHDLPLIFRGRLKNQPLKDLSLPCRASSIQQRDLLDHYFIDFIDYFRSYAFFDIAVNKYPNAIFDDLILI